MDSAIVKLKIKTYNDKLYFDCTNVVFSEKYRIKTFSDVYYEDFKKAVYIPLEPIAKADIKTVQTSIIENSNWKASADIMMPYFKDFGILATTKKFDRFNSNIYKNIFEHLIFDLYLVHDELFNKTYKKDTIIFQPNHGFELYDLLYVNSNGVYKKGIANEQEYNVIGIVSEVINNNEFVITTHGIIGYVSNFNSDSSILYLSESNSGKFDIYENITTQFYTPVGFITDNKIIINIMDSSMGNTLKKYQENIFNQNLTFLSNSDLKDIADEVYNSA